jgi:hypothetical protein
VDDFLDPLLPVTNLLDSNPFLGLDKGLGDNPEAHLGVPPLGSESPLLTFRQDFGPIFGHFAGVRAYFPYLSLYNYDSLLY